MQETLIEQRHHSNEFHTRLWWMEVVRGAVNIIFGIILLTHTNFTLRILIYTLGIYLIIDGTLDIFKFFAWSDQLLISPGDNNLHWCSNRGPHYYQRS